MRAQFVRSTAVLLLCLFCAPRTAHADLMSFWEWLDRMSGPGPWVGVVSEWNPGVWGATNDDGGPAFARYATLGERWEEDEREDVDDDHGADQKEPSGGQPAARLRFGRRRRSGRLRDRVGRDLLARHAASTHRSAACRRARSVVPAASAGYSIVLRNLLTSR